MSADSSLLRHLRKVPGTRTALLEHATGRKCSYECLLQNARLLREVFLDLDYTHDEHDVEQSEIRTGRRRQRPVIGIHMHRGVDFFSLLLSLIELRRFSVVCLSRDMQDDVEQARNEQVTWTHNAARGMDASRDAEADREAAVEGARLPLKILITDDAALQADYRKHRSCSPQGCPQAEQGRGGGSSLLSSSAEERSWGWKLHSIDVQVIGFHELTRMVRLRLAKDARRHEQGSTTSGAKVRQLQTLTLDDVLFYQYTGGTTRASKCVGVTYGMLEYEVTVGYPALFSRLRDAAQEQSRHTPERRAGNDAKMVPVSPPTRKGCSRSRYRTALLLGGRDEVEEKDDEGETMCLNYFSLYWAASCIGEWDIAMALGGCLVIAEFPTSVSRPQALADVVLARKVSVLGAVPSILESLQLEPSLHESLQLVFTWGEALSAPVAEAWRKRGVALCELLISTEYWLSLYRLLPPRETHGAPDQQSCVEGSQTPAVYDRLPESHIILRRIVTANEDEDDDLGSAAQKKGHGVAEVAGEPSSSSAMVFMTLEEAAASREIGELCISGPMVGRYLDGPLQAKQFVAWQGRTYFRTKDLARCADDAGRFLSYCGRLDDFAKIGGKWVDVNLIVEKMKEKVWDAVAIWDPNTCTRHFCVEVRAPAAAPPAQPTVETPCSSSSSCPFRFKTGEPALARKDGVRLARSSRSRETRQARSRSPRSQRLATYPPAAVVPHPGILARVTPGSEQSINVAAPPTLEDEGEVAPRAHIPNELSVAPSLEQIAHCQKLYPRKDARIHFLTAFPRNKVTAKVDRRRLLAVVAPPDRSEDLPVYSAPGQAFRQAFLRGKILFTLFFARVWASNRRNRNHRWRRSFEDCGGSAAAISPQGIARIAFVYALDFAVTFFRRHVRPRRVRFWYDHVMAKIGLQSGSSLFDHATAPENPETAPGASSAYHVSSRDRSRKDNKNGRNNISAAPSSTSTVTANGPQCLRFLNRWWKKPSQQHVVEPGVLQTLLAARRQHWTESQPVFSGYYATPWRAALAFRDHFQRFEHTSRRALARVTTQDQEDMTKLHQNGAYCSPRALLPHAYLRGETGAQETENHLNFVVDALDWEFSLIRDLHKSATSLELQRDASVLFWALTRESATRESLFSATFLYNFPYGLWGLLRCFLAGLFPFTRQLLVASALSPFYAQHEVSYYQDRKKRRPRWRQHIRGSRSRGSGRRRLDGLVQEVEGRAPSTSRKPVAVAGTEVRRDPGSAVGNLCAPRRTNGSAAGSAGACKRQHDEENEETAKRAKTLARKGVESRGRLKAIDERLPVPHRGPRAVVAQAHAGSPRCEDLQETMDADVKMSKKTQRQLVSQAQSARYRMGRPRYTPSLEFFYLLCATKYYHRNGVREFRSWNKRVLSFGFSRNRSRGVLPAPESPVLDREKEKETDPDPPATDSLRVLYRRTWKNALDEIARRRTEFKRSSATGCLVKGTCTGIDADGLFCGTDARCRVVLQTSTAAEAGGRSAPSSKVCSEDGRVSELRCFACSTREDAAEREEAAKREQAAAAQKETQVEKALGHDAPQLSGSSQQPAVPDVLELVEHPLGGGGHSRGAGAVPSLDSLPSPSSSLPPGRRLKPDEVAANNGQLEQKNLQQKVDASKSQTRSSSPRAWRKYAFLHFPEVESEVVDKMRHEWRLTQRRRKARKDAGSARNRDKQRNAELPALLARSEGDDGAATDGRALNARVLDVIEQVTGFRMTPAMDLRNVDSTALISLQTNLFAGLGSFARVTFMQLREFDTVADLIHFITDAERRAARVGTTDGDEEQAASGDDDEKTAILLTAVPHLLAVLRQDCDAGMLGGSRKAVAATEAPTSTADAPATPASAHDLNSSCSSLPGDDRSGTVVASDATPFTAGPDLVRCVEKYLLAPASVKGTEHENGMTVGPRGYMTPRYFRGTVNWHFELERRIPKAAFYFACALLPYYYPELVTDLGLKDGEGADEVKVDCSGVVKILQETGIADLSEPVFANWPRMLTDTRAALRVLFAQHCEGADDFFDGDELCNVAQSKSNGEVDTFQVAPSLSPTSPGQGSQRKKRVPLVHHCVKVGSDKELGKALRNDWTEGRSSWKPFRILQVVIENPTRPEFSSTRLVMVVNHAVGDANAMTPLLKTFIQLTRGFESMVNFLEDDGAAFKSFRGVMRAALPKLPVVSTLHTVEDRLRKGLFLDHVRHGKQIARSDCASTFWGGPLTFRNVADGFLLTLEQTAMVLMRRLSKDLRIPLDHIICALAGLAYYKSTMETYYYYATHPEKNLSAVLYNPVKLSFFDDHDDENKRRPGGAHSSNRDKEVQVSSSTAAAMREAPDIGTSTALSANSSITNSHGYPAQSTSTSTSSSTSLSRANEAERRSSAAGVTFLNGDSLKRARVSVEENKTGPARKRLSRERRHVGKSAAEADATGAGGTAGIAVEGGSTCAQHQHHVDQGSDAGECSGSARPALSGSSSVDEQRYGKGSSSSAAISLAAATISSDKPRDEGARGAPVPDPKLEAITNVGVSEITDAGGAGTTTSAQTSMTARKVPSDEWKATPHPRQQGDHAAWYVRVDEYTPHAITTDSFAEMKANYYVQPGGVPPVPKEALKRGVLPYRILVPNRDGPHEEELLANVVVDRTFEINMRNQTYFGAVHELSSKLRNREWHAPAATDPWAHQRIGMNIRPAVRDVFPGVKQQLEWQKTMPGVNPRRRYSEQPLDAFVDEHNTGEWTYQFAINPECAAQGFTLAVHFFEILQKLSEAPLDPIIFENSP